MTIGAAEVAQVSSYCLPQFDVATARGITQQVRSLFRQNVLPQAFPNSEREFIHSGQPRDERDRWRTTNADIELTAHANNGHSGHSSSDKRRMPSVRGHLHPGALQK